MRARCHSSLIQRGCRNAIRGAINGAVRMQSELDGSAARNKQRCWCRVKFMKACLVRVPGQQIPREHRQQPVLFVALHPRGRRVPSVPQRLLQRGGRPHDSSGVNALPRGHVWQGCRGNELNSAPARLHFSSTLHHRCIYRTADRVPTTESSSPRAASPGVVVRSFLHSTRSSGP